MRENNSNYLPNEHQLTAALTEGLDQATPRRDLWPSIRREINLRKLNAQRPWWRKGLSLRMGFPKWALATFAILAFLVIIVPAMTSSILMVSPGAPDASPDMIVIPYSGTQKLPSENFEALREKGYLDCPNCLSILPQAQPTAQSFWSPDLNPDMQDNFAYEGAFFKNYGVNPFIDTAEDHRSTFAMDVDTASYAVMRRFVQDGHRPDPDSVRVEEFVNYFDQGYAPPSEGACAIHIDGAPSPFGRENLWLMRVGLQGRIIAAAERKDASLVFVIDVSGSMAQGNRLGLVQRSLRLLVDELRPTDQVGIVVYGSRGRIVLEATSGEDKEQILAAIDGLEPGGSTNADEGLQLGYRMAEDLVRPERITRVILLSDGVANVGNTGSGSILEEVQRYVDRGITLSTVGFGMGNYNDVLMERLANDGDGNYAYVDTLDQARRVFVEDLTGTLQVIAKDAKIQVIFNPEVVRRYRLLGYEDRRVADEDFRDDSVDGGGIGAGHSVTALYELEFHEGAQGLATEVFVRYQDPDRHQPIEASRSFSRENFVPAFDQASPRFQLAATVAEYAEVLRESDFAQGSSLKAVNELAERVGRLIPDDPDIAEFIRLTGRAE